VRRDAAFAHSRHQAARWPLFTEEFGLIFNAGHSLAAHPMIEIEDLRQERWLRRAYCEQAEQAATLIRGHDQLLNSELLQTSVPRKEVNFEPEH
jgi:DNA-binding transcriptional LysR family regulator